VVGDTPWMDSAILAAAGVETVVCGPAGAGAHAAEEWVDLDVPPFGRLYVANNRGRLRCDGSIDRRLS